MKKILLLTLSIALLSSCMVRKLDTTTDKFFYTQYNRAIKESRSHSDAVFVKYSEMSSYNVFVTQDDPSEILWAVDLDGDLKTDIVMPCHQELDGSIIVYEGIYRHNFKDLYFGEDAKFMDSGFKICDRLMKKGYRHMTSDLRLLGG